MKRQWLRCLGSKFESIEQLGISNSELPSDILGKKSFWLDINVQVDRQWMNLEVQIRDEGDYPERALFNWPRPYSPALPKGNNYTV